MTSRCATAGAMIALLAAAMGSVWLATDGSAGHGHGVTGERPLVASATGIGACLRIASADGGAEAARYAESLERMAAGRRHLFPAPAVVVTMSSSDPPDTVIALWTDGAPPDGDVALAGSTAAAICARAADGWSLRVSRELLENGARRLLDAAEYGDGWTATIGVQLHAAENLVRTKLDFSGPLGVEGSCWLDETLVVDPESSRPDAVGESHNDAGLVGLVACSRFGRELARGGAGAQALELLPADLSGDAEHPWSVSWFAVDDEMVTLAGPLP